jgi:hypothetical protein
LHQPYGDNPSKDKNGLNNGEDTMSEIQTEVDVAKPLLMGQNKNDKDEITLSARVPTEPKQYNVDTYIYLLT